MLITVSRHTTGLEAHIIRTRLEAEEIPAFINFEQHISANWSLSLALGGIQVQVPPGYRDAAQQVVTNIDTGVYQAELEAEFSAEEPFESGCPHCGSNTVIPMYWPRAISLFLSFLYFTAFPFTQHLKMCVECRYQWIAHHERGYPLYIPLCYIMLWAALILALILSVSPPIGHYIDFTGAASQEKESVLLEAPEDIDWRQNEIIVAE